jgi:hypothetical protein
MRIIGVSLCGEMGNQPACAISKVLIELFGLPAKIGSAKIIEKSF